MALVDAGYAQALKSLVAIEHREWLDYDNNCERWFNNEVAYTAKERRVLITQWAGQAWKKLNTAKYDKMRWRCWEATGALITADGSDDEKIKPKGLPDYIVPPPLFIDPPAAEPQSNVGTTSKSPFIISDDEPPTAFNAEDELLIVDDEDEDVDVENIFEIIDNFNNIME